MIELYIVFQLHEKKNIVISDMVIPVPKGLSNAEVIELIKNALATIEGAGAILNIINLNNINPKTEVVKDYTPRQERSSFPPRKEKSSYGRSFSRDDARPSKFGDRSSRPSREDRLQREDSRGGFRKPSGGGGYGKKSSGGFPSKSSRSSRPSRSR